MHWAARLYRQAVRTLRPASRRKPRHHLRFESLELRLAPHVSGTVFIDVNQDGVQDTGDAGAAGVTVLATDGTGATSQAVTDINGDYELTTDAANLRLEFSGFPIGTLPGRAIGDSGPAVRFLTAGSPRTNQNLSLAGPNPGLGSVQVGDRLFVDTNENGLQDANEPGISGVVVQVFQGTTEVDSVTSGAGGDFLFDLDPDTSYELRIDTTQAALGGRVLALANQGTNDQLDSDFALNGTNATAAFTTEAEGTVIHSLDAGFVDAQQTGVLTLGDTVFRDANDNGLLDTGETGVAGVTVELLDQAGTTVLETTTTNSSGVYTFVALEPGTYRVRLAASNFTGTGALVDFTASGTAVADPENNQNDDSNGVTSGTLGTDGFIISGPIVLADGTEPINDGDTDPDTNLSLDFGVVPPITTLTLGDTVFGDANDNGTLDTGETGVIGVVVELLDQAGTTVLTSATTNANGVYTFTGLAAGTYRVRLAASNFTGTGALVGFTASGTAVADPENNQNNDSNGVTSRRAWQRWSHHQRANRPCRRNRADQRWRHRPGYQPEPRLWRRAAQLERNADSR